MDKGELLIVRRLSSKAFLPTKGSAQSAGFDIYSAYACKVPARGKVLIMTDLQVLWQYITGCYCYKKSI